MKTFLDPLAADVSAAQLERQRENRKRKRKRDVEDEEEEPLRLKKVYVEGFAVEQVWEQVKRVVEGVTREVRLGMGEIEGGFEEFEQSVNGQDDIGAKMKEDEVAGHGEDEEEGIWEDVEDGIGEVEGEESTENLQEDIDDEGGLMEDGDLDEEDEDQALQHNGNFVEDPNGLNDGFFSIDDFNRQSQFLEQIDTRGGADDGAPSDEEEIDWAADPLTSNLILNERKKESNTTDNESGEEDEDGPIFSGMDLDAPEGASGEDSDEDELDLDDQNDLSNANNIMYADFFAPPPQKSSRKKGRPMPHNFPTKSSNVREEQPKEDDEDIERTMAAVHRDLFSDEEDLDSEENPLDPNDSKSRRSTHERHQASLLQEIRKLEAQNVAKRNWTLSGEARANDRPVNSLLEEDLEFERTGKPVPVITKEVSEDIEAMIKRRILNKEFDEVLRRRPDELLTGSLGRRGVLPEVDDTKSKKSLAELYEEEYMRKTDPNFVDPRDDKLKKEHMEIEKMWKEIVSKLDSLCNWHYRPRPVEMTVQVRSDAPAVSMEDARPSGVGGVDVGEASQLAPQEVYRAGDKKERGEVLTKGGAVMKTEELTREQKLRRRRREKERAKKAASNAKPTAEAKKDKRAREKKDVVSSLKKGGVTVIGRTGELLNVEGNSAKGKKAVITGGSLKL